MINQKEIASIFWSNVERQLKHSGLTQKEFAAKFDVTESKISKWKKGNQFPDIIEIRRIADFFNINTNDLLYSEQEKLVMERLSDPTYKPISATQIITTTLYENYFTKYFIIIAMIIVSFIVFSLMTYIISNSNPNYLFQILILVPTYYYLIPKIFVRKKNYIVDHLDLIYYEIKNHVNKHYILSILFKSIIVLLMFGLLFGLSFTNVSTEIERTGLVLLFLIDLLLLYALIYSFFVIPRKYKMRISDKEIESYKATLLVFLSSTVLLVICLILGYINIQRYLPQVIVSSVILILASIEFILVSKKYSEYQLMYEEFRKKPRILYTK